MFFQLSSETWVDERGNVIVDTEVLDDGNEVHIYHCRVAGERHPWSAQADTIEEALAWFDTASPL